MSAKDGSGGRRSALRRTTRETEVLVLLDLDGGESGRDRAELVQVDTGIGFLDHLLSSLAFHAGWGLELLCRGDLWIDDHHSVEDCAILLGEAFARALAAGGPSARFGSAYAVLDEALARAVIDISGRPYAAIELGLGASSLGEMRGENAEHFLSSFAYSARLTLHVDVERGTNAHHRAEAAFKATALALREAGARPARAEARRGAGGSSEATASQASSTKGAVSLEEVEPADFAALRGRLGERPVGARDRAAGGRASGERR
jgi:imidazoleglycerol-phosphate dehydratase